MVALLRAAPQAGRLLRPLCRMLAVEAEVLRPVVEAAVVEVVVEPVLSAGVMAGLVGAVASPFSTA